MTPLPARPLLENDFRAMLFDLDGTLVDTHGLIVQCYEYTMQTHLNQPMRREIWERLVGQPLAVCRREGICATPGMCHTYEHEQTVQNRRL